MSEEPLIGLKDVYTEVVRLVGHMEGIDQRNKAADLIHQDHEARLRMLERWRYALPTSIMVGLSSISIALVALFLGR